MFIGLNSEDLSVSGIEWVVNFTIYYYPFKKAQEGPEKAEVSQAKKKTKETNFNGNISQQHYVNVKVTDSEGKPLSKTTIELSLGIQETNKINTSESGECKFENLDSGKYTVKALKQGYIAQEQSEWFLNNKSLDIKFILKKSTKTQ